MKYRVLAFIAVLAIGAEVAICLHRPAREPSSSGAAAAARSEDRFAKLRKYADDSATAASEYAEECEARGDLETAEAYYLKARVRNPELSKAVSALRRMYLRIKKPEAGSDPRKLANLIEWLHGAGLDAEAEQLAREILGNDPENASALAELARLRPVGEANRTTGIDLEQAAREKGIDLDALSVRDREIFALRTEYDTRWRARKGVLWFDAAPAGPFVLCMEKSELYAADLMLAALGECAQVLWTEFGKRYGSLFDAAAVLRDMPCFIYVFSTRERYLKCCDVSESFGGHFSELDGRVFLYKDTSELYETMFHLLTHQLLFAISKNRDAGGLAHSHRMMFWFSEGLSTYFENFKHDAAGAFVVGQTSPNCLPRVRQLLASGKSAGLPALMKLSYHEVAGQKDVWKLLNLSAEAWALAYFLNARHRDQLDAYLQLEVDGKGGYDAAQACFGDLDALNEEYERFIKSLK